MFSAISTRTAGRLVALIAALLYGLTITSAVTASGPTEITDCASPASPAR
jgi:hypothetical protein